MGADVIVPSAFFLMVICVALGIPLVRAYSKKMTAGPHTATLPSDLIARLERIEQGIEAMSMEVERISEGQRFTTKLLSEHRTPAALPAQSAPAPQQQPHQQQQQQSRQQDTSEGTVLVESARRS